MSEVIRGNLGRDFVYFEKTDEKQAMLSFSVAERKYAPPTTGPDGKEVWGEPETIWHNDVVVRGTKAGKFKETFDVGDAVILVGNFGDKESYETKSGEIRAKQKFFVSYFGPDATQVDVEVVRRPKAEAAAEATHEVAQSAEQDAQQNRPEHPSEVRNELMRRADQLVQTNRLSESQAVAVIRTFDQAPLPQDAQALVGSFVLQQRIPDTERLWLTSVLDEYAGAGKALAWNEAEELSQRMSGAPSQMGSAPASVPASAQLRTV